MRIIIQFLLLSTILFASCKQNRKRPEPNFYKNLYTQEVLNKAQYRELINSLHAQYDDSLHGIASITIHLKQLNISNDSVTQPFNYDVRVGKEYKMRAYKYDKLGMNIAPKMFRTIQGDSIQIGGIQSRPTLINLWFVHCPGCVAEIPALNRLQEKYADKVNFIALTFEEDKDVIKFLRKRDFKFKHIANVNDFIKQIGSKPYPENIFIDRNGNIRYIEGGLGASKELDMVLGHFESIIEELLLPIDNIVHKSDNTNIEKNTI